MIFRQFHLEGLGHASYFIGSESTGEAIVIDARRDVDIYLDTSRSSGLRIAYAMDTHQHNDYVSGITGLAARTGAQLLAGGLSDLSYSCRKLADGEQIKMGEVLIRVLHTPGHTPEHVCLLITDLSRGREPSLLLTGGFLLVGDMGRPDLMGDGDVAREQARVLYRSLTEKILSLPDHVEIYPTHVSGSLCGGTIGSRLSSTVGYERSLSPLLKADEEGFISRVLDPNRLPAVPPYWRHMRGLNQRGASLPGILSEPPALPADAFDRMRSDGCHVLDCRSPEAFSVHIPGALSAGLGSSFPTWAGTVLPFGEPYLMVIERERDLWEACMHLLRIGFDLPKGWLAGGMFAWRISGKELAHQAQWTVHDLRKALEGADAPYLIDVRQPAEWSAGHVPDAHHLPGAVVARRMDEIPVDRHLAVICGSGYRSSAVGSVLAGAGRRVSNVIGGMAAWRRAGYPVVR